jgi:nucleoside-triphosphatase THEP1
MINSSTKLNDLWLKSAALGSLWASNEIILGSFLHNIRLPLSGTIMSFFSVVFIVAFVSRWPQKGLIIRAGFIAAIMKSMAPSAIILGPMVGIVLEAFILEAFFRLSKGRTILMFIGGGLAVSEVLFQKVGTLLISFGWDIMKMLESLYHFVDKQLGSIALDGNIALIILFTLYITIGIAATFIGIKAGKLSYVLERDIAAVPIFTQQKNKAIFSQEQDQVYSWWFLVVHILVFVLGLYLINNLEWYYGLLYLILYFILIYSWYKNAFSHLKKFSFWVVFISITLLAGLLFNHQSTGEYFSLEGLLIGVKMNIRAALVVVSFAAIGRELKSPVIKAILYQRGLQNFYRALSLAFGILPESLKAFPSAKELLNSPVNLMAKLLLYAENLITELERRDKALLPIIIISGNIQEGKTTFVQKVVNRLKRKGIVMDGFLSKVIYEGENRVGYRLEALNSQQGELLCKTKEGSDSYPEGWIRQGKFYFNPLAIKKGNDILKNTDSSTQLIIIDEIGPLEAKSKGWAPAIQHISEEAISPMLWVVRESLIKKISRKWPVGNIYFFRLSDDLPALDVENMVIHIIEEWEKGKEIQ